VSFLYKYSSPVYGPSIKQNSALNLDLELLIRKISTCCIDCTGNTHCHNSVLGECVTKDFLGHFSAPFHLFSVQNRPQVFPAAENLWGHFCVCGRNFCQLATLAVACYYPEVISLNHELLDRVRKLCQLEGHTSLES
jgi:hypothetical protein